MMSEKDCHEKYKLAKLDLIIDNFLSTLSVSYGNMKMLYIVLKDKPIFGLKDLYYIDFATALRVVIIKQLY